ncbi:hypothetical protein GCM10010197_16420 [Nocardioides luteus]|uniref:DUF4245 domain-containing protein n=1 Tax=Nocardioides luteus TaxID=1844 RepID=A0ABQ5SVE8_9ACTN|nr:hypothetical protein GCM10010197_16420 [Nocardioides luteus]GLJ67826.1 hypothetical protein GCM10017579_18620 [Nocardioides luteus]
MEGVSDTDQQPAQPSSEQPSEQPETPARSYPRTFGALIGSMIFLLVLVVPIVLIVQWRGNLEREVSGANQTYKADWAEAVRSAQAADIDVIYPRELPSGWYANTDPSYQGGEEPAWTMSFVKGETSYVGLELSSRSAQSLAQKNIDTQAKEGDEVEIETDVATTWTEWSDSDGDSGYSTEVDGQTLMLWGPKDGDVRDYLDLLTDEPLAK